MRVLSSIGASGFRLSWLGLVILVAFASPARAAVIDIVYIDSSGFGFNDNQAIAPVAGNPGRTLGAQRRNVMEAAADIWASRLDAAISVRARADFDDLECGEDTTLGLGGTTGLSRNFNNAPRTGINYPISLAAALSGRRFEGFPEEMRVTFNFRIDEDCLDGVDGYWYGLDPAVPPAAGTISFLELALHELGHGLGFASLTNRDTREFLGNPPAPDIMSEFLFGIAQQQTWSEMNAQQRDATSRSGSNLVWIGEQTNQRAAERLLPPGSVQTSPAIGGQSSFPAFIQGFPPFPPLSGLSGNLVLVDGPGLTDPSDPWARALACEPLDNAAEVGGNIALVRRGDCTFAQKWQMVFDAGAIGLLLVDNLPAGSAGAIERDRGVALDRVLPIPIWFVPMATGDLFQSALPLNATLGYNLAAEPRGTNQGFVNMQASPDTEGANVSHFSNTMLPPSLMNPSITGIRFDGDLDFVPEFMHDIGWPSEATKRAQYSGNWFNPARDGEGCHLSMELRQERPLLTCYLYRDGAQIWLIGVGTHEGDRFEFPDMFITRGADFGTAFDPNDVVRLEWGEITMQMLDCNTSRVSLNPEDPTLVPFVSLMTKLVPADCNLRANEQVNRAFNGSYFDPNRDGEGIQLSREGDGNTWVMTFYTYLDGEQVWVIGAGTRSNNRIQFDEVTITSGGQWGPAFDPDDIERTPFGAITLDILNCDDLNVTINATLPEFESSQRTMTRVVPRGC
ncbi:MAG: PA domain-containing protein [Wenzhouxiangella sp.]